VSTTRVVVVMEFEVYYDYTCPFVYRASLLLASVAAERSLDVSWRYFSLTQVNSKEEGWTAWDAPAGERVRGRLAFMAAEAARRQDRFEPFHATLLRARHEGRINIDEVEAIEQVAEESGLDLERFRRDLADPTILAALARDHIHAVTVHGVFGTPTFVFPNGASAYIRLAEVPGPNDAAKMFDSLIAIAADEQRVLEIKRPVKPTPD
jgi:2-hydroxychromene-2-carboxylate isomerase